MGYSIVAFDESSFRLSPVYRRVWFYKSKTPIGRFFISNKKATVIGAIIDGKDFYYEWVPSLNTFTFYVFLTNFLEKYPDRKFVFIMDNVGYHKTSPILELIEKNKHRIVMEFIPPYSPELNPIETCWKITKYHVTNSVLYESIENMKEAVSSFLENHRFSLTMSNYLCP